MKTTDRVPVLQHLAELRRRLIISLLALACGAVVCWIFYPQLIDALLRPYCDVIKPNAEGLDASGECRLLVLDPLEPLTVRMSVSGYGGLILAFPIILFQALRFIGPGLHSRERRMTLTFVLAGALLFAAGVTLAVWSIPRALGFLSSIGGEDLVGFFSPRRYLGFVVKMSIAFGAGFEFPVLLVFAQFVGLVSPSTLKRLRRYALLGIVVLGALLTPSGDPFTLLILSGPMYAFYEAALLIGSLRLKRIERAERAEEGYDGKDAPKHSLLQRLRPRRPSAGSAGSAESTDRTEDTPQSGLPQPEETTSPTATEEPEAGSQAGSH